MAEAVNKQIDEEIVLRTAVFNKNVVTYIYLVVLCYLVASFIGWVLVPFWLLGLGQWLSKKYFHTLTCQLTTKNLQFGKGIFFHIEKTIPLENIQDLSFYGGPILRALGLTLIRVETAGGGGKHDNNMMSIPGIIGAEEFKREILNQREIIKKVRQLPRQELPVQASDKELLKQIHNELVAIKNTLQAKV